MPYSKKAERTIRAIAHGWHPKKKSVTMSQDQAKKLSKHIERRRK